MTTYTTPHSLPIIQPSIDKIKDGNEVSSLAGDINELATATNAAITAEGARAVVAAATDATNKAAAARVNAAADAKAYADGAFIHAWKPLATYAAGQRAIAPNGDVVSAKSTFTSGAAYSAVNWNPSAQDERIGSLEEPRREVSLLEPSSATDSRVAVNSRIPFRIPFATSKYRIHIRNRNPSNGIVVTGALSFTAVGIGTAQTSGATIYTSLVESVASTIQGAFSTPADGSEFVTSWKSNFALTPGVVYFLTYGYSGPPQANYAGSGVAYTNNSPTGSLSRAMASPVTASTSPLDIWIEAITDAGSTRKVAYAGIAAPTVAAAPTVSSRTSVTAFGDSLTDGGSNGTLWPESDSWPTKLDLALPNSSVTNLGYSGATVDELLMRIGAMPIRVMVPTGGIAASGNALVTPMQTYGMPPGIRPIDAILGESGVRLNKNADGSWQLYNYGSTPIPPGLALITPAGVWAGREADTAIIWIGINDNTGGTAGLESTVADHIVAGTQRLVSWLSPQIKQFMILGITTRTNEVTGNSAHTTMLEVNRRLRELYPGNFRSVQDYLRNQALTDLGITPTQEDLDKIAAGTIPPSVLAVGDVGHISKATAAVLATNFIKPYLVDKGWVDG